MTSSRPLKVFLCHASQDKPAVRKLYTALKSESWIDPWLDEENLLPGQDFDIEIYKATRDADAIIICLSKASVAKEGYVNKEIRRALDIAEEKPEGAIYVIPLRLDDCSPSFERLKKLHWVDYFTPTAHEKLLRSLRLRAAVLKIETADGKTETASNSNPTAFTKDDGLDLIRFIKIEPQKDSKVAYPFWIGKYPVTNAQYERFLNAPDFANPVYWLEFPKFDENCQPIGNWGRTGVDWLKEQLKESKSKILLPRYWNDKKFGQSNPNHPIVGISWYEANAYCEWLFQNWDSLDERIANPTARPQAARLPLETEWVTAAGGEAPTKRFPWDEAGKATILVKEILRRANTGESEIGQTTPVTRYPLGKSPIGVMDMAGNVWEWQANYRNTKEGLLGLRGGSWGSNEDLARVASRGGDLPLYGFNRFGFRVALLPSG